MGIFELSAILITLSALFSYINHRFIKLPTTIGLMVIALLFSLLLILSTRLGFDFELHAETILASIDFDKALLEGMLSALLFAGALHVNLDDLLEQKWVIALLASVGVVTSTLLIGYASYYVFGMLGVEISLIYCLLFGALISPTDPIAVLGILKKVGVPKTLETKITGESLFNDGVAVVVFLAILTIASDGAGGHDAEPMAIAQLFLQEAVGGALFGFVIGFVAYRMLSSIDQYEVEVLISLAVVLGGYAAAIAMHLSAPIAIVVAGLLIGNHGRRLAMSERTREHLDNFWELIDEILNAVLFVLIGLELMLVHFEISFIQAGMILIPVVVLARFVAVGVPVTLMKPFRKFTPHAIRILTWGGLRGGISVALALSIPNVPERDMLIAVTYLIVVFSIFVQGLTVGSLVKKDSKPDS
ncbi:cation:proton antiporter [Solemya velum gill symbiont]|uniref:cation:proton antiporter n=1 Tax=Solemya velum gill symbiont TaxID=2340 RepID=UPI0009985BD6|nr:sodium:proton antiporter [Solemya velum gill symbiont]OOZ43655.1 sodium:proton antiporter [Solemya velum gill symbiont]OOZ47285.1 sodium:proton antiporter [Solemya velum gill symbiont]OOZ48778.1 sodium:proton antiporter [Solemya velum gill symbiont]OOZ52387.1 sodium:proton antiporter [Solemya velum gill symbiont]OOZ57653.1 sodium:proton antiporter [Solemya velum gill symbiont]